MNFILRLTFLLTLFAQGAHLHAQVAEGQELITVSGTARMHELTLNTQVATTITFPSAITLVSGYGMVLDAARAQELMDAEKAAATNSPAMAPQAVTIVHYAQATPDTLVMRAVRRGTPCFVTVRCNADVFLFKFIAGEQANLAVIVSDPAASKGPPVREVKVDEVLADRTAFSASELLGILSKARQREFLETVNPSLYEGWQQRRGIALTAIHGDFASMITEVQQWPAKDALVLRCKVENKGERERRFNPTDVKVRIADRTYPVQLADGKGVVAPGKTALLDLVLQGNVDGGKEHLSVSNDFRLEIAEDTTPPPDYLFPRTRPMTPIVEHKPSEPEPQVIYNGNTTLMPEDPVDRRAPLPNLYSGK
jgi:hypothetical protein